MMKRLAFLLFIFLPIAACSSTGGQASDDARKALLVAEYGFQAALRYTQTEVAAGRLKGQKAADVSKALAGAKAALDVARAAIAANRTDAGSLVVLATQAVAAMLTALQPATAANPFPAFAEGR